MKVPDNDPFASVRMRAKDINTHPNKQQLSPSKSIYSHKTLSPAKKSVVGTVVDLFGTELKRTGKVNLYSLAVSAKVYTI